MRALDTVPGIVASLYLLRRAGASKKTTTYVGHRHRWWRDPSWRRVRFRECAEVHGRARKGARPVTRREEAAVLAGGRKHA